MCGGEISLCAPPVEEENKSAVTLGDLILYSPLLQTQDEVSAEYFLSLFDQISMWDGKVSICLCKTLLLLLHFFLFYYFFYFSVVFIYTNKKAQIEQTKHLVCLHMIDRQTDR